MNDQLLHVYSISVNMKICSKNNNAVLALNHLWRNK